MSDYFLRSSRLGFRCWRETDLPLAVALWGDPAVTRYVASRAFTAREVQLRLEREIAAQRAHAIQYWPIFLLESDEHVGCCGLRLRESEPEVPELGVHVASRHWRKGYAFEAASRVIDYAFSVLGSPALFAGHNPANDASRALLARLGFVHTHDELYPPTGLQHPSYRLMRA
ncbi:MAG TPA: GNAT family N-acetyltransferase [Casimicrobiaceae bacterium]|nr:GNAT family N-acetyltransferase [Casimicrobiaceae bacterium]